ncbi:MAG: hypothetical protein IKT09_07425 [Synergistes sp.]|nr:hypothetical protein [Synergistes sp.]
MGGYGSAPRALNDSVLTVAENIKLTEKIFWMSFDAPELAVSARAGNCVFVYPSCGNDPMLGRPFAAADADPAVGRISVCYMVVGRGTAMLSAVKPGERLKVRAFTGKPYPEGAKELILAAGGVGAGAVLLKKKERGKSAKLFIGIPGRGYEAFAEKILSLYPDAQIYTDDGSFGRGNSMFAALPRPLSAEKELWCCGPLGFFDAMRRFYESTPEHLYYILEKRMACGFGGCMGCVVETSGGPKRVCVDRAIFRADEVDLHDN